MQPLSMWFFIHFLLLFQSYAGSISKGSIELDYSNAGFMGSLSFSLKLDTPLQITDYIKVSIPFPLHASLLPSLPATEGISMPGGLSLQYQAVEENGNHIGSPYEGQLLTEGIDSSNYYIRFYGSDRRLMVPIAANQWYILTFKLSPYSDAYKYQKAGEILQIQVRTVSSVWSNALVYDDNFCFNFLELEPTPLQNINISVIPFGISVGEEMIVGNTYGVYIDVSLPATSYHYSEKVKLEILVKEYKSFLWTGVCSSIAKLTPPTISAMNSLLYSCTINTQSNKIEIVLSPEALAIQKSYRFSTQIKNPSYVTNGVSVQILAKKEISTIILWSGIATNVLKTKQISVDQQEISVGWGMKPDPSLLFDVRLFRSNSATPTYEPVNTLQLKFSLTNTTPDIELKIEIGLPGELNTKILSSGIIHDLPAFTDKVVKCRIIYHSTPSSTKLQCTGVGQLIHNKVYKVGWKTILPYNILQPNIDCTKYGVLSIYTAVTIDIDDKVFVVGRSDTKLKEFRASDSFAVAGRNSSYIGYATSFGDLVVLAISADLQDYLSGEYDVVVNNNPSTSILPSTFVLPRTSLSAYLALFPELHISCVLSPNVNLVKSYHSLALVPSSISKNTLIIQTVNSKDWRGYSSNLNNVVSSATGAAVTVSSLGLRSETVDQSIVMNMMAPYADVSSVSSANSSVTYNWAMLIMTSSQVKVNNPTTTLTPQVVGSELLVSTTTIETSTAFNNYTLIILRASTPARILNYFPVSSTKKVFSLYPFLINKFTSLFADSNSIDFMIATADGIDGPINKIKWNGYFMFNAMTMMGGAGVGLDYGYVGYAHTSQMDGTQVPTMLRIKGTLSSASNFHSFSIFFDKLTPFYLNPSVSQISCFTTDPTPLCTYHEGKSSLLTYDYLNYHMFSRIDIKINNPTSAFDILIPVKGVQGKAQSYFYIGYTTETNGVRELGHIETLKTITHSGSALSTGTFGPDVTGKYVGEVIPTLSLKAAYSGSISTNSAGNIGGSFLYFSESTYLYSSSTPTWSNGPCHSISYLINTNNYIEYKTISTPFTYVYKNMSGIACFMDTSSSISSASLSFTNIALPTLYGKALPGYGGYSTNNGNLETIAGNYLSIPNEAIITDHTTVTLPIMGPLLTKEVSSWKITLPISIQSDIQVEIGVSSGTLPFTTLSISSPTLPSCVVRSSNKILPFSCSFESTTSKVTYKIVINEMNLLEKGALMEIVHYGFTTGAIAPTTNINMKIYTINGGISNPAAPQLILSVNSISLKSGTDNVNYLAQTSLTLSQHKAQTANKAAVTKFTLAFSLINKGLFYANRVVFNLGQYAIDSAAIGGIGSRCKVYTYDVNGGKVYSHDWEAVDWVQGFNRLELWPKGILESNNLTYTLGCSNFISASTSAPTALSAKITNTSSDIPGDISSVSLALLNLPPLTKTSTVTLTKQSALAHSPSELTFTIVSPGITLSSIVYIGFPTYYSYGLGADIKCYGNGEIYCVVDGRELAIYFSGVYTEGVRFVVKVFGVEQPLSYSSTNFYYKIDDDADPSTILASGYITDSSSLGIVHVPVIQIVSMKISSTFLRDSSVTLEISFYMPSSINILLNYYLSIIFPAAYSDILRFIQPECSLTLRNNTLKNYVSYCNVMGMKIKMAVMSSLPSGNVYTMVIKNMKNPTWVSSENCKYIVEISNLQNEILGRTDPIHSNFISPNFTQDPTRTYLSFFSPPASIPLTIISSSPNVLSSSFNVALDETLPAYSRNLFLRIGQTIYSEPQDLELIAGGDALDIKLGSSVAGVKFVEFGRAGDGEYYANLPPLTLLSLPVAATVSQLSLESTTYTLPISPTGTNYSISLNSPKSQTPLSAVSFELTLSSNSTGVLLRTSPTIITFGGVYGSEVLLDLYVNNQNQWITGSTVNLILTPQTNTMYSLPTTVTLNAGSADTGTPTLTFVSNSILHKSIEFSATCSKGGRLSYHLARYYSYNTTACSLSITEIENWLRANSTASLHSSETYYQCLDILTTTTVVASTAKIITLSSLLASTKYQLQLFCVSKTGVTSSLTQHNFTTTSNGGYVSKMDLNFESSIGNMGKGKIVCALALVFGVGYQRVATKEGWGCTELVGYRYLQEESDISVFSQIQSRLLTSASNRETIYFDINTNLVSDTSPAEINTLSIEQNQIKAQLAKVVGLPLVLSVGTSSSAYVGTINEINNSTVFIDVGADYLYIQGLTLPNNGLIYIIIAASSSWSRAPLISEIKKGSGPNGQAPIHFKVLGYRTTEPYSGYAAFDGISKETMKIYIMASDDNPFETANFGKIWEYTVEPEVALWGEPLLIISAWLLFILI